jgi:hypothetical protein
VTYPTTAALIKTGQTVSYATRDDGDVEAGRNASFLVLAENNYFGNTNRFTDELGGQTYANNLIIDWSTFEKSTGNVLMWSRVRQAPQLWAAAIASSIGLSYFGKSDWRLPNFQESASIYNYSATGSSPLNYGPFAPNAIDNAYWCGTTSSGNTAAAVYMALSSYGISTLSKVGAALRWIAVRTANISEL